MNFKSCRWTFWLSILEKQKNNAMPTDDMNDLLVTQENVLSFSPTEKGRTSQVKLVIRNHSHETRDVEILRLAEPFFIRQKHQHIQIKPRSFLGVPLEFRPPEKGTFRTNLLVNLTSDETAVANINGCCLWFLRAFNFWKWAIDAISVTTTNFLSRYHVKYILIQQTKISFAIFTVIFYTI